MRSLKLLHLCLIILLVSNSVAIGQQTDTTRTRPQKQNIERPAIRNVVWFTPTKAKKINGLTLGSLPSSMFYKNDSLHINGMQIEANPVMFYLVPYIIIGALASPFAKPDSSRYFTNHFPDSNRYRSNNIMYGINISILGNGDIDIYKGISLSSMATLGQRIKGISIAIGQNSFYEFQGLLIAGLMNNVTKGSGLQIGLINRCKECKGVQIGLLNKMSKRTLPFINVQL